MRCNPIIIFVLILIVFIPSIYSFENPEYEWKIEKHDYMQKYINYEFDYIDEYTYKIYWSLTEEGKIVYDVLKDCIYDNEDSCVDSKATKYKDKIKNYDKNKENILGIGKKYSFNEFQDEYFQGKTTKKLKEDAAITKNSHFPMTIEGYAYMKNYVNPMNSDFGTIIIYAPKGFKNTNHIKITIGFSTLVSTFTNGQPSENLNFGYIYGFRDPENFTRYLRVPKYTYINDSFINLTGVQGDHAIYHRFDYFDDSTIDPSIWQQVLSGGTITESGSGTSSKILLHAASNNNADKYAYLYGKGTSIPYVNLSRNTSIHIYWAWSTSCYAGGGESSSGRCTIVINGSTSGRVVLYDKASSCSDGSSDNDASTDLLKININQTTGKAYVINATNRYIFSEVDISALVGDKLIGFECGTNTQTLGTGNCDCNIYKVGYQDNKTLYQSWNVSQVYPNGSTLKIGGFDNYFNATKFNTQIRINMTKNLTDAVNDGACDCVGCVDNGQTCDVPFYFHTETGAILKYSAIEFNGTSNFVNVTFRDVKTLQIILENISVSMTNGISYESTTTSGTVLIQSGIGTNTLTAGNVNYLPSKLIIHSSDFVGNLTMYLLNDTSDTALVKFLVQDRSLLPISNATFSFYRKICGNYTLIKMAKSDSVGLFQVHLDTTIEYKIIVMHPDYPTTTLYIVPFETEYTIILDKDPEGQFDSAMEGIIYIIKPKENQLDTSEAYQQLQFTILNSFSDFEYFGMKIINSPYQCVPSNCMVNSTSANGGSVILEVKANVSNTVGVNYFFKRSGYNLQYINDRPYVFGRIEGRVGNVIDSYRSFENELGGKALILVVRTFLISGLVVVGAQMGIVGLGLLIVYIIGTIFFMIVTSQSGIDVWSNLITILFSAIVYWVLTRDDE